MKFLTVLRNCKQYYDNCEQGRGILNTVLKL